MWNIEPTDTLGRIVVPPDLPESFAVFCTTRDFDGRLSDERARTITDVVRDRFGVDSRLTTCTQVHGATVRRAMKDTAWRECDSCDALFADANEVALGIKIADCLPVALIDPTRHVIANVHSGWRGAVQRITAEAIDALRRDTLFEPREAFAYLGPSIRVCCFEVGEEVAAQFASEFVDRSRAKPHIDLVSYTVAMLRAYGFTDARVSDSELCTRCEGSIFHSYRREGKGGGRNLNIVAM
jgi:YfiH family protein